MAEHSTQTIVNRPDAPGVLTSYVLAFGAIAAAVLLRYLLNPWMGDALPLVTLFGAVAAAVWVGGYRPAIVSAILGYLACDYLFIEPRGRLAVVDLGHVIGLLAYLFTCSLIIGFGEAMRLAQMRANEQRELLRVTLRSIGDAVITTDVDGRVTYMNAVAESLTGWMQTEPSASRSTQCFGSSTRKRVCQSRTRRRKRFGTGSSSGSPNHTVLIRKDGSECPDR